MDCSHDDLDGFGCGGAPPGRRARRNAIPDVGESLRLEMQMAQMESEMRSMCRLSIGGGGPPQHEAPPGWATPNNWGERQLAFSPGPSAAAGGAGQLGGAAGGGGARTTTDVANFACYDDPELEPFMAAGFQPATGAGWSEPATGATIAAASLPPQADFDLPQAFTEEKAGQCGRWGSNRSTGSCQSAMSFMSDDVYRP